MEIARALIVLLILAREAPAQPAAGPPVKTATFIVLSTMLAGNPAGGLRAAGLRQLLGAHCTGIEAVFRIRQLAGLTRRDAVVASVGSSFTMGKGIDALQLAR